VLATSLSPAQASAPEVLRSYRRLLEVESTFRVLKNFIALRPVYHWTEARVRAHVGVCVLGAVIEALIEADLRKADVRDPDLPDQVLSPRRALRELGRIRAATIVAGERTIDVVTRRSGLQARVLGALGVDTAAWDRARVS
jgi:transposase